MFEYEEDIVSQLLGSDHRFQQLYQEHARLKAQVQAATSGVLPMDDLELARLKRKKLLAKDKMAHIIARYQQA